MIVRILGVWIILLILAILNAGLREKLLTPKLGKNAALLVSTGILVALISLVSFLFVRLAQFTRTDLLLIGAIWLSLTVSFEFVFGHFVMGHSWQVLLADYSILKGRVWVLVPVVTFISPLVWGVLLYS